jgi:hypothetical protein
VSSSQPDQRFDADPLLAFSIEPGVLTPPAQLNKPVTQPQVATPPVESSYAADLAAARRRIEDLERTVEQANAQMRALNSEVATLVGVTADIKKQVSSRKSVAAAVPARPRSLSGPKRMTSAIAGVVAGVLAGIWIWLATSSGPIELQPAASVVSEQPAPPAPAPPPGVTAAAIVPVAAIAPARDTAAAGPSGTTTTPARRIGYVGTLSIDSDPSGEVLIDRRPAGRTPLSAANLKAGSHLIWIQRDGYKRFTRVVQVGAGKVNRLVADLEPIAPR